MRKIGSRRAAQSDRDESRISPRSDTFQSNELSGIKSADVYEDKDGHVCLISSLVLPGICRLTALINTTNVLLLESQCF
jgi:hypothetical protein